MINANKIRARIMELGMTQKQVAKEIGMAEKTFSIKMNNGKFGLDEADRMIEILKIDKPNDYFFTNDVAKQVTNKRKEPDHDAARSDE